MAGRGSSKTPGALRDILNTGTPGPATGKRGGAGKYGDDRTVDVGALLRGRLHGAPLLQVPKLRGGGGEAGAAAQRQHSPPVMEPNPVYSPGSPDAGLVAAASKLAHLKASSRMGGAAAAPAAPPLLAVTRPAGRPAAEPRAASSRVAQAPAEPATTQQRWEQEQDAAQHPALAPAATEPPSPMAAAETPAAGRPAESPPMQQQQQHRPRGGAAPTPEYRPERALGSGDEAEVVPLAARTGEQGGEEGGGCQGGEHGRGGQRQVTEGLAAGAYTDRPLRRRRLREGQRWQPTRMPLSLPRAAIIKRHRRKSQHHGPERFGDW